MKNNDTYQSFLFKNLSVRGAYVDISVAYSKLQSMKNYNNDEVNLISQALINSIFLCQNKINHGRTLLQYRNPKTNDLLVAQATSSGYIRAMLKTDHQSIDLSSGQLCVFYQPDDVALHQQSIIEVLDNDLLKSLMHFFSQSEQTETMLWYFKKNERVIGIYLQQIPGFEKDYLKAKELINQLTDDTSSDRNFDTILNEIFADYSIYYNQTIDLKYGCENSNSRFKNALLTLGKDELTQLINYHETIDITCDFCSKIHSFSAEEISDIVE